jgi:hypothetical protein
MEMLDVSLGTLQVRLGRSVSVVDTTIHRNFRFSVSHHRPSSGQSPMVSTLLQLPGELRDSIYAFSLSEAEGLFYPNDDREVGWLCLAQSSPAENNKLETSPAEARESKADRTDMIRIGQHYIVGNQLCFVNKQLRHETKALGLRYNKITFHCSYPRVVNHFLQRLPIFQQQHLRQIIIKPSHSGWGLPPCASLIHVCNNNPGLIIRYHIPSFSLDQNPHLLRIATRISILINEDRTIVKRLTDNVLLQQEYLQRADEMATKFTFQKMPPNIHILPRHDSLDETSFRKICEEDPDTSRVIIPNLERGIDALVELAKDWCENGL